MYLKLDKKLILKIDKVAIEKNRKKREGFDEAKIVRNINLIKKLFETIKIKKISYLNYNVTFLYNNEKLFIDTDDYKLVTRLHIKNSTIFLKIEEFKYKKYGLLFKGTCVANVINKSVMLNGKYFIKEASGNSKVVVENSILNFKIDSNSFNNKSLEKVTNLFPLNKKIKSWIYKKIVAKSYKVKMFKGEIDLKSKKIKKLYAIVNAYDAVIKFNKNLPPVKTKKIIMTFKDNTLYFQLEKPIYLDKNLDGSYVVIKHPEKKDSYIDIILMTSSPIDEKILKIVKNYSVHLPIYQKNGFTNAQLKIRYVFNTNKLFLDGKFNTTNSLLNIDGIDLYAYSAKVRLKNSKIYIDKSMVEIKNLIKSYIEGSVNLNKKISTINIINGKLKIEAKNYSIINMDNFNDILTTDFTKKGITKLDLKKIKTSIIMTKNKTAIYINDLKNIEQYSPILKQAKIDSGNLTISTPDFENFQITAHIVKNNNIIYYNSQPVKEFNIEGFLSNNGSKIYINDNKIKIFYKRYLKTTINGYDLNIKEFKSSKKNNLINFSIYGYSSNIDIFGRKILSDKYILKYENGRFDFINFYKNAKISANGSFENYSIEAKSLNDVFVKNFLDIYGIKGGNYNLKAIGKRKNLKGKVTFFNATLKDMALLNNIMAFLNTIPSLITFSDPGYNKYGYYVKKGVIDFYLANKILYIKNFNLEGKSINFQGDGIVDLNSNRINMNVTLTTFKNISNILNKIPVAGYILLGKKGNISTKLKIEGSLIKPKISTNIAKETIKAPLNILKRALEMPFEIFK